MNGSNQLFANEVLVWRLIGASVWQTIAFILIYVLFELVWHPLYLIHPIKSINAFFTVTNWLSCLFLILALAPAAAMHAVIMNTSEKAPKHSSVLQHLVPQLAVLFRKVGARWSSPRAAATWFAYLAAHTLSAILFIHQVSKTHHFSSSLHGEKSPSPATVAWTSVSLASMYLFHVIYWSRDILSFPSIQRHRYFRIKQLLPTLLLPAASLAIRSSIMGVFLAKFTHSTTPHQHGAFALFTETWINFSSMITASFLCSLCWLTGTVTLETVFTERLRPDDYGSKDCLKSMQVCLDGTKGNIMKDLALHDYAHVAVDTGRLGWQRQEMFADDSGSYWQPFAQSCIVIVNSMTEQMAEGIPGSKKQKESSTGAAKQEKQKVSIAKWNVLPSSLVTSLPLTQKQTIDALTAVCCQFQRTKYAIRSLSDFAVASLSEDRFGVVQLAPRPTLGEVILSLCSAYLATRQLMKQPGCRSRAVGPWRGSGETLYPSVHRDASSALNALHDELKTSLYHITGAFGPSLKEAVTKVSPTLPYGTAVQAVGLLDSFFTGEE